jgi:hypothetical protein
MKIGLCEQIRVRTSEINHLQSTEAMRKTIMDAGFVLVAWNDVDSMVARSRNAETPHLGLHLALGSDFAEMVGIFGEISRKSGCGVVQAVFQRVS